ncbi:MAG: thioredoxin family protein [Saprospiraceae bacterium]
MKSSHMHSFLFILSLVFFTNLQLHATVFFEGSLQAAKEKAKNENKMLMLKFGAKWCLPCRFMDNNVFTDDQIIEVLSKNSVSMDIDIEDANGLILKEKFNVKLLPTMLVFHPDGRIIDRREESLNVEKFGDWINDLVDEYNINPISINHEVKVTSKVLDEEAYFAQREKNTAATNEGESILKEEAEPASSYGLTGQFYIQTGAFNRFENAQSEATRLDKIFNQDASIIEEQLQSGKTIFKIALGSFITEEEANLFLQNLEKHAIKGLIRKIEY